MLKEQQQVKEFFQAFGQTVRALPELPTDEEQELRVQLIQEELEELRDAFLDRDIVQVADAIADLLYVVLGVAVCCGINITPIFQEVHRSNMTKVGGHRAENGKWIKPETYSPANLAPLIELQQKYPEWWG